MDQTWEAPHDLMILIPNSGEDIVIQGSLSMEVFLSQIMKQLSQFIIAHVTCVGASASCLIQKLTMSLETKKYRNSLPLGSSIRFNEDWERCYIRY